MFIFELRLCKNFSTDAPHMLKNFYFASLLNLKILSMKNYYVKGLGL